MLGNRGSLIWLVTKPLRVFAGIDMGSKSRNKGASGERELIHEVEQWTGVRLERNLSQAFGGGHDLIGLDEWAIECKRYASISNADKAAFWRQAVDQARRVDKTPAVCFRQDRDQWRVLVPYPTDIYNIDDFRRSAEISLELFCGLITEKII